MDVDPDNLTLDGLSKTKINWYLLTSYLTLGSPGIFKRVKLMRPNFIADKRPAFELYSFYDYLVAEPLPPSEEPSEGEGSAWDAANWDVNRWVAGISLPFSRVTGGSGIGRTVSIALVGSSFSDTFLASFDIMWDQGGFL